MSNKKFVNIACGGSYILDEDWTNLDYKPAHRSIRKANLLEKLPFADNSCDVVYSSHFLEHIPKSKVPLFLKECYRILKSGGKIRLVLPDLENICKEYLSSRESNQHEQSDFCIIELIDQSIRTQSGGILAAYYQELRGNLETKSQMISYVKCRTGEDITIGIETKNQSSKVAYLLANPKQLITSLQSKLTRLYILIITSLLPSAFREQNVSYASVGEKHLWMWDFYTLGRELENTGFSSIKRLSFNSSQISDFPVSPLDMTAESLPRMGYCSMYIEANK
jgi:predicted SAM-dependent methyltransferase